jgi:hypothetical protein
MSKKIKVINQLAPPKPNLTLQDLKSLYYHLNAKPDTEIKTFNKSRVLEIPDLIRLNDNINEKLNNHQLAGSFATIKISFTDKKILDISSWREFLDTKWDSHACITHIEIQWDFNIVQPRYELPQRHALKLRFGSRIKPREIVHIMLNTDSDIKYHELEAQVVCRVDFINSVISTELINLVSDWYKSLPLVKEQHKLLSFMIKHRSIISDANDVLFDLAGILVGLGILRLIIYFGLYGQSRGILLDIGVALSVLWASVYIFSFFGRVISMQINELLYDLKYPSMFNITRGDKNKNLEKLKEDSKFIQQTLLKVGGSIIADIIMFVLHILIKIK